MASSLDSLLVQADNLAERLSEFDSCDEGFISFSPASSVLVEKWRDSYKKFRSSFKIFFTEDECHTLYDILGGYSNFIGLTLDQKDLIDSVRDCLQRHFERSSYGC